VTERVGRRGRKDNQVVTLSSIADQAGTTAATVSRVLARSEVQAKTALAKRVWQTAKELNYRPNTLAASLRTKRSNVIGVTIPRMRDEVLALMYEGIEAALAENGYQTLAVTTNDDPVQQEAKIELLIRRQVDGLLIGDALVGGKSLADVRRSGVPNVLYNRRVSGYTSVTCNDYMGGQLAAEHLLGITTGPLAVYSGMDYATNLQDRARGFMDTIRAAGRTLSNNSLIKGSVYAEAGENAATRLLLSPPYPEGVFLVNDMAAIGFMGECSRRGLSVGESIKVVGFNDVSVSGITVPSLTTIRSPMNNIGKIAALTLVNKISGKRVTSAQLSPSLIVRSSTGGRFGSRSSDSDSLTGAAL
jgi:LacI family transcriptional regulator